MSLVLLINWIVTVFSYPFTVYTWTLVEVKQDMYLSSMDSGRYLLSISEDKSCTSQLLL